MHNRILTAAFAMAAAALGGCASFQQPMFRRGAAQAAARTIGDTAVVVLRFGHDTGAVDRIIWADAPAAGRTMKGRAVAARTMGIDYRVALDASGLALHLGVTEAGPSFQGTIKSATAFGILLSEGLARPRGWLSMTRLRTA